MSHKSHFAKSILDASFGSICGKKTIITNDLSVREWECEKCGTRHDRDINASINIMIEGLKLHYGV